MRDVSVSVTGNNGFWETGRKPCIETSRSSTTGTILHTLGSSFSFIDYLYEGGC